MKLLSLLLVFLLTIRSSAHAEEALIQKQWTVDGATREALIYAPADAKTTPCPVVFAFHGHGGAGCSVETLAELIGDTPQVAFAHYGREWGQYHQDPLWAAVGGSRRS